MITGIRAAIEMKKNAYKEYITLIIHNNYGCLENLTSEHSNLIRDTKTEYHSKHNWSILVPVPKHTGQF